MIKWNLTRVARALGLLSMSIVLITASLAAYLRYAEAPSMVLSISLALAVVSFPVWAACGLFLWGRLWVWLFRSWRRRADITNLELALIVLAGSIVLPLFFTPFLVPDEGPMRQQ